MRRITCNPRAGWEQKVQEVGLAWHSAGDGYWNESAYYEFVCKSAGVPVHYCAETFANDGSLPSLIMKALKRTMAGEYSRELGVKVLAGQKRLALLGFKQGGMPGYGLRRLLVSSDGILSNISHSANERASRLTE